MITAQILLMTVMILSVVAIVNPFSTTFRLNFV